MQTLERYRSTHSDLRQMIDDLRSLLTIDQLRIRPNAKTVYELMCDLGERVQQHLAEEDHSLYPRLLIHEDPRVQLVAWRFISGEKPLRQAYSDYYGHWLKDCDFNFTDTFLDETDTVVEMVAQRIAHEEQALLPKLLEIGLYREAREQYLQPLKSAAGGAGHAAALQ